MSLNFTTFDKSTTSPISKSYEVPPFEEAFEEDGLKRFYQERDSFSQTSSPHKEPEINEEYFSSEITSEGLLASPLGRYVKRVADDPNMANAVLDIELDSGMQSTYPSMNTSEQEASYLKMQNRMISENGNFMRQFDRPSYMDMGDNNKIIGNGHPLTVQRAISLPSNNSVLMTNTQPLFPDSSSKPNLDELIKNKKVFNIQRNQKSPQIQKLQSNNKVNPTTFSLSGPSNNINFEQMNQFNMNQANMMINYNTGMDKNGSFIMNYLKSVNVKDNSRTRSDEMMPEINFMQKSSNF